MPLAMTLPPRARQQAAASAPRSRPTGRANIGPRPGDQPTGPSDTRDRLEFPRSVVRKQGQLAVLVHFDRLYRQLEVATYPLGHWRVQRPLRSSAALARRWQPGQETWLGSTEWHLRGSCRP